MEEGQQHANIIKIQGYSVYFPEDKKPFAPQLALMSKLLLGLKRGENCLLESPTGTGKTVAVLCAALAWLNHQKETAASVESDGESDGEDKEVLVKNGEAELRRPFQEFEYVEDNTPSGAAEAVAFRKRQRQNDGPVELAYDENVPGAPGGKPQQDETFPLYRVDKESVFETSPKKRKKNKTHKGRKSTAIKAEAQDDRNMAKRFSNQTRLSNARDERCQQHLSSSSSTSDLPVRNEGRDDVNDKSGAASSEPLAKHEAEQAATATQAEKKKKQKKPKKRRISRIYMMSRTHSQLSQVIGELKTCVAADPEAHVAGPDETGNAFSMTLLASRKSTCINADAYDYPKGIDDGCKRLVKDQKCFYQRKSKWAPTKLPPVWDVEEAVRLGKRDCTCPYYNARKSLATANLILCPYNYLVDPTVREVMGINLKDAVVIFDEAHNLEDAAREAASAKLSLSDLGATASEMQRLGSQSTSLAEAYALLQEVTVGVKRFLEETDSGLSVDEYEKAHKVYKGEEALGLMRSVAGVTADSLVEHKKAWSAVMNDDPAIIDEDELPSSQERTDVLSGQSRCVISSLIKVLGFLFTEGMENVEHYKMVVLRERGPWQPPATRGGRGRARGGRSGGSFAKGGTFGRMETYLCFWCLSASVCFSEINKQVHSIVLTSGTLSPLDSFAGEMGIEFEHRLEAPHVIDVSKQCLVTSVGYFGGVSLDSRYTHQHDLKYQDSIGRALLQYASVVPGGILTFFPSYGLMEMMYNRWKAIGLLDALDKIKAVHLEPRGQGKIDGVLSDYCAAIKEAREAGSKIVLHEITEQAPLRTGALMLAVARGKVSEGIDFSDDAARMCVIVGIPYPSSKDLQVVLKKEYQHQQRQKNPSLVGGGAWYNLQAFRAVNQAVGRCIRHRNDFGAIVLCDPRYSSQPEATASLSRWVRSSVQQCRTVEASLQSVDRFFRHHLAEASDRAANAAVGRQSPVAGEAVGADSAPQGCSSRGGVCGGAVSNCRREDGRGSLRKDDLRDVPKLYPAERVMQPTVSQVCRASSVNQSAVDNVPDMSTTFPKHETVEGDEGRLMSATSLADNVSPEHFPRDVEVPGLRRMQFCCVDGAGGRDAIVACAPAGNSRGVDNDGGETSRPRRVIIRSTCHLYRVANEMGALWPEDVHLAPDDRVEEWQKKTELWEVPRDWAIECHVIEEEAKWVAQDGMVYVPLECRCCHCFRRIHSTIGVKAVAAGLHGADLVGRSWFFPGMIETTAVDMSADPEELMLPTHAASLDPSRRPNIR